MNGGELSQAIVQTREQGYGFVPEAVAPGALECLVAEAASLELALDDRSEDPVHQGTNREISYRYEQRYFPLGDPNVSEASGVGRELAKRVMMLRFREGFEPLYKWLPNGLGYQQYNDATDHLGPHRDAASEKMLRATVTLNGAANILIHEALSDPDDYTNTRVVDVFEAKQGDIMFLRAPGFGNDERVIHEVLSPHDSPRLILNLRMTNPEA